MNNFGLISHNRSIPLRSVSFVGIINEHVGEFTVVQEYVNNNEQLSETEYIFPLSTSASITNVTIQINERVLKSKLTSKTNARNEFKEAVENKHKALLLETTNLGYRIKIGNIDANEKIMVKYTYFDNIIYDEGYYKLVIPTSIAPHYSPKNKKDSVASYNNIKFSTDITWFSANTIQSCTSLTHPEECKITNHGAYITAKITNIGLLQDFNLLCKTKNNIDK